MSTRLLSSSQPLILWGKASSGSGMNFPYVNPCWCLLATFFFMCLQMFSRIICFIIISGIEIKLARILLPFLKDRRTSPEHHNFIERTESGPINDISQLHQHSQVHPNKSCGLLYVWSVLNVPFPDPPLPRASYPCSRLSQVWVSGFQESWRQILAVRPRHRKLWET